MKIAHAPGAPLYRDSLYGAPKRPQVLSHRHAQFHQHARGQIHLVCSTRTGGIIRLLPYGAVCQPIMPHSIPRKTVPGTVPAVARPDRAGNELLSRVRGPVHSRRHQAQSPPNDLPCPPLRWRPPRMEGRPPTDREPVSTAETTASI